MYYIILIIKKVVFFLFLTTGFENKFIFLQRNLLRAKHRAKTLGRGSNNNSKYLSPVKHVAQLKKERKKQKMWEPKKVTSIKSYKNESAGR